MQAYLDRKQDKVLVKVNGKVKTATITTTKPTDDVIEITPEQIAQQELATAEAKLQAIIKDAKEKAELVQLGIETQAELDRKVKEYKDAKKDYNDKKGAKNES